MSKEKDYSDEDKQASKKYGDNESESGVFKYRSETCSIINENIPVDEYYESLERFNTEMKNQNRIIVRKNNAAVMFVKDNINYDFDLILDSLDELDWEHVGYVEVEETSNINTGYPSYKFYLEKGNPKSLRYMRQDDDGEFHNMVWQTVGHCEDDYSGFLLFPLNDGRYWKISYSC
jgi:hypothetical protein